MNWLRRKRWYQVFRYGILDAKKIAIQTGNSSLIEFYRILYCFHKYNVFSNQYFKCALWQLDDAEKTDVAKKIGSQNFRRDEWAVDCYRNRKFIEKWSKLKWGNTPQNVIKRRLAYTRQFNAGTGLIVQHNVDIHREHFLDGTIKIGNNVLLAKNVFLDYSGYLEIKDDVALSDGVVIETHSHVSAGFALKGKGKLSQSHLVIEEGVSIGSKALVLETCSRIGRHSRIGAGAVIRNNVPPYAIVLGNPAKVVGFVLSPEEVQQKEMEYPVENRIPMEKFLQYYNKYRERTHDILKYIKL